MRILYVIESLARAGAEQSLAAMAPNLRSLGVDIRIAYLHERPGLREQLLADGVPLRSLADGPASRRQWMLRVREVIDEDRPDIIHTTLFEADLAGRLAARSRQVPVVSSLVNTAYGRRESGPGQVRRSRLFAAWAADAATAQLVTRFHAVTDHVADVMARRLLVRRSRIDVVGRGRDPEQLGRRTPERRDATRRRLGLSPEVPVVLAVARHEYQKGLDVLVRALPRLLAAVPDAEVVVAGRPGVQTDELHTLAHGLGISARIQWLGMREDVPDLLVAADLLAFPSRWEGAAGTLLEAMALECPIVATSLPTLSGVVDDGTALLVPTDDAAALAIAMARSLVEPGAADRAERARQHFLSTYTLAATCRGMAEFYDTVATTACRQPVPRRVVDSDQGGRGELAPADQNTHERGRR
jgi:glycosyltransferase involved in cell wall biosynthesis